MKRLRPESAHVFVDESERKSAGFTLVEMLVSVTLVVLMMMMFAQIFQLAAGSISTQRSIAQNDQRGRTVQTVLRADLDKRTFRSIVPFRSNELAAGDDTNIDQRQGYFYISEGDPYDDTDDILQLTVRSTITVNNRDQTPYYGRAISLGTFRNQPDWDDGLGNNASVTNTNSSSLSTEAEVAYFVRAGNLYRRVVLIRNPVSGDNPQPTDDNGAEYYTGTTTNFWQNFDFSAFPHWANYPSSPKSFILRFHGSESLLNDYSASTSGGARSTFPLGLPKYRFGFWNDDDGSGYSTLSGTVPGIGRPREYLNDGTFIGRFTHEETSHADFSYPGNVPTSGGPMRATDSGGTDLALNTDGTVSAYAGGTRRAEDILLTNVISFDVKVLDPGYGEAANRDLNRNLSREQSLGFADIGHDGTGGLYRQARNRAPWYGPKVPTTPNDPTDADANRVYDTWHPSISQEPPFGVLNTVWTASTAYSYGDLVRPPNGDGSLVFQCRVPNTSQATEPDWPTEQYKFFYEDPSDTANSVAWYSYNARLSAIQITIRYFDPSSTQIRQLTIVHSLVD